jgi:hypothetical protein
VSEGLSEEEREVVDRVARKVVRRGLTAPVILFLESMRPLNFVASQAMLFFGPFASVLFERRDFDVMQRLLERRESIEEILSRIEELDDEQRRGSPEPGA